MTGEEGWISLGVYELEPPAEAMTIARTWCGDRGGLGADDVMVQPLCGRDHDGRWSREARIFVRATAAGL
ncbi:hypothetical protein [Catenulispora subtropica]|uniref:Uncharacterized protein n=1 Tax=Catenulispora subtropica TaxID=450798 RepID=A0ABN2SSX3_9ACTN